MATPTPPPPPPSAALAAPCPLFGGFVLVAATLAWLSGTGLRAVGLLPAIPPLAWLLSGVCAFIAVIVLTLRNGMSSTSSTRRLLAIAAALLCALTFGAARAAWADPTSDPHAISHLPANTRLKLRGDVAAEPDIRGGLRYLVVDVYSSSLDSG